MNIDVEQTVRENIDNTIHMSLATTANDRPWICEVHFAYDDDLNLYFRSYDTRRHSKEIAANPRVAGNIIDKFGVGEEVIGIYYEGRAELMSDADEVASAARLIMTRLDADDSIIAEHEGEGGHKFYKISVSDWYCFGRFGQPSSSKHHLPWNT